MAATMGKPNLNVVEKDSMQRGKVHGAVLVEELICQTNHMLSSKGVFLGSDPLKYSMPLLLFQMSLIILTTRLIFRLIKPLNQGIITAQVLAGIILGPSLLGQNATYMNVVLPVGGKITLQTLSYFGLIIHLFLLGLKIDPSMIRKAGTKAVLIGTACYTFPFSLGMLTVMFLDKNYNLPVSVLHCMRTVIPLSSTTSFPVTTNVLAELNILNSELGRLATNCAIVCEACNWIVAFSFDMSRRRKTVTNIVAIMWILALLFVIVFVCRPIIIRLTERSTRNVNNNEEIPFFPILLIMCLVTLAAETLGFHAAYGAFMLGVSLPDGPPLGTGLTMKLDSFATSLLLPCFVSISGLETDFFIMGDNHVNVIEVVILVTYGCKFAGTAVVSLYCNTELQDALCLAFLMCCQGIVEIYTSIMLKDSKMLNTECFNLVIITLLIVTGFSRFLVVCLYDPSKRYKSASKRTIVNARQRNLQLRFLLCIHDVDNIPSMVNLLEASYPTRFSPISVCTLHLVELKGRAHSVLVPHHQMNKLDPNTAKSVHIVNAFQRFEQQNQGTVMGQHFTAVAPFSSINDDICTLALDKLATLMVIPFHKQYAIDGTIGRANVMVRNINLSVVDKAPCSVGILIDRGETTGRRSVLMNYTWQHVAVLFIGGLDDSEALALCMRIAEHPDINVTVIHFRHKSSHQDELDGKSNHNNRNNDLLESKMIQEFKTFALNKSKLHYREEIVKDGVETTQVISSLEDSYDMVMVGRDHDLESSVMYGLTNWNDCRELGVIGDILSSPDFHFSVLVIHQQPGGSLGFDNSYTTASAATLPQRLGDSQVHPRFSVDGGGFTTIDLGKN